MHQKSSTEICENKQNIERGFKTKQKFKKFK